VLTYVQTLYTYGVWTNIIYDGGSVQQYLRGGCIRPNKNSEATLPPSFSKKNKKYNFIYFYIDVFYKIKQFTH
jgi:hypothetical protein